MLLENWQMLIGLGISVILIAIGTVLCKVFHKERLGCGCIVLSALAGAIYLLVCTFNYHLLYEKEVAICLAFIAIPLILGTVCLALSWKEPSFLLILVIIVLVLSVLLLVLTDIRATNYEAGYVMQPIEYEYQKYELLAAVDGVVLEGEINGETIFQTVSFLVQRTNVQNVVEGKIQQKDVYKFYYVANSKTGEIKLMTLDASTTSIYFIEEGETPYLQKKIGTKYAINREVEPNMKKTYTEKIISYELHIPKGSIVEKFEFDLE